MADGAVLIHLSDIECGPNNRAFALNAGCLRSEDDWYAYHVSSLVADARHQIDLTGIPSSRVGLVLTGDLTSVGNEAECMRMKCTLHLLRDGLGISPERVAMVPGNHDVCWEECRAAVRDEFGNDLLDSPEKVEFARTCGRKLKNYKAVFDEVVPGKTFVMQQPVLFDGVLEMGVAVIGFDSTFPCAYGHEHNFGIIQAKQLEMAGELLEQARARKPGCLAMALAQHCLLPLRRDDNDTSFMHEADKVLPYLRKNGFRIVLAGHEHRRASLEAIDYRVAVFTAGSYGVSWGKLQERYGTSGDVPNTNRYQIVVLRQGGDLRVSHRMRDAARPEETWVDDVPCSSSRMLSVGDSNADDNECRPRVFFSVGDGRRLPSGECVRCVALRGSEDQIQMIRKVIFTLTSEGEEPRRAMIERPERFLADFRLRPGRCYGLRAVINSTTGERVESLQLAAE